ncbi:MAG: SIR2 family protein [Gammaproteobacteria bacterium]|nr:SIR2 family protein [Gammaproteobacteria bacterium]
MSNGDNDKKERIVYLFGAGASQAWVDYRNCPYGILMRDLNDPMERAIRDFVTSREDADRELLDDLTNDLIGDHTDYEHIMTFLDESPSAVHRRFSAELRLQFEAVLRNRFADIQTELADEPSALYAMLLDMYNVEDCPEELQAILTINYDNYIEAAAEATGYWVDFGIDGHGNGSTSGKKKIKLVKLHGSFYWNDTWPITYQDDASTTPLWIPPGIEKAKKRYPFNLLWGIARELLQCDVLRIVGCKLSGNDWDLISLLFTTRHSRADTSPDPYRVEVIDSPARAKELKEAYPYLDIRSAIDDELLSELDPAPDDEPNWFLAWLQQKADTLQRDVISIDTRTGTFRELWEEM